MTAHPDKPKRWRPRFSVRTLVVVVTLMCCYAACWGPTKRQGVEDVYRHAYSESAGREHGPPPIFYTSATGPFVVGIDQFTGSPDRREYYFWFFGLIAKLPIEREVHAKAPSSQ
jgi:hypothetical protein